MPGLEKADRRDEQRKKKQHGMRVSGKNIAMLLRAQEKRDKERMKKHEEQHRDDTR